jgi:hypothetical protein
MDNKAILDAVKAIEEQLSAIKTALGTDNQDQNQSNPMVTPEKPSMMAGLQLGK